MFTMLTVYVCIIDLALKMFFHSKLNYIGIETIIFIIYKN